MTDKEIEIISRDEAFREWKETHKENGCEKCGGELKIVLSGDESYNKCMDCGYLTLT